jgi:serine/threonine-protein phosphatase 6 catalytic subunit
MRGFEWRHNNLLVGVWSAPNYDYKTGNAASVMRLENGKAPEFQMFEQDERSHQKPRHSISQYFV